MLEMNLTIINKLGLHARAAARLVATANQFNSEIIVNREDKQANGKSIVGLMMLAAAPGTILHFVIQGEDEVAAQAAIQQLIEDRFGEEH